MDTLIPIINKLQDTLSSVGLHLQLDLPQIVVVGSQSVGKSSVLESLVGRDFLPRGTGIVTRRPLILQLRNINGGSEFGEFAHLQGKHFTDFDQIRQEIEEETDRTCGKNKAISAQPILLKIFSPNVIDLTLVDLPGITKIPIGDQPTDVEMRIRDLISAYISKPNALILAVTAGNTDIANSDALKLAREFDPEGARTVGVITKLDLMDEGTDALEILSGKSYPLKLGYVGVVCRSQKDIQTKRSVKESLRSEDKFFRSHPSYKHIAPRCGTLYMAKLLHKVLMYHIRDCLPGIRVRIIEMNDAFEQELNGLGEPLLGLPGGQAATLLNIFTKFCRNFSDTLEGKVHSEQLIGGARINFIFNDIYTKTIAEFDSFHGLTDAEIRTAIRNATGPRAALFVPEVAFETLVKRQIAKLEEPSLQCAELVYEELVRVVHQQCEITEMTRFSFLKEKVQDLARRLLLRCLSPTNAMITNLVACELAYINTNHPDFIGGSKAISNVRQSARVNSNDPNNINSSLPQVNAVPTGPSASSRSHLLQPSSPGMTQHSVDTHHHHQQQQQQQAAASSSGGFLSFLRGSQQPAPSNSSSSAVQVASPPPQLLHAGSSGTSAGSAVLSGGRPGRALASSLRLAQVPAVVTAPESPSGREVIETEIIKSLILSYFNIVKKTVCDVVPKVCMLFMVNASKELLQKELVKELYKEELFNELLKEGEDVSERRAVVARTLKLLRGSLDILGQIRDHNVNEVQPSSASSAGLKTPSLVSSSADQNRSSIHNLTLY